MVYVIIENILKHHHFNYFIVYSKKYPYLSFLSSNKSIDYLHFIFDII